MNSNLQVSSAKPLLRNRAYLSLIGSQLVSNLGDWLYLLAMLTLIGLKWEATPWQITAATLCMVVPVLIGGPLTGLLADRMERKKMMVLSDLARIVVMIGFVFAGTLWHVYALLIAKGIFDIMFSPAKNGKLKEIVPKEQLEQAVSYSSIIEQGSKIVGPAIGGVLTAAFGEQACFLINAACFGLSALLLLKVPGKPAVPVNASGEQKEAPSAVAERKGSFWGELAGGMRIIVGIPLIAYGLMTLAAVLLVLQIADSQIVVLFREIQGMPDDMLGYCIALSGAGTLLAAVLIRVLTSWPVLVKMGLGGAAMGIVFAAAGLLVQHGTSGVLQSMSLITLFFLAGLGAGMTFIPFQVTLQQQTPEHLTGRVFGTVSSVMSAATLLGPMLGGLLVTSFGPEPAFLLSGLAMAVIGLLLLAFSQRIQSRHTPIAVAVQKAEL